MLSKYYFCFRVAIIGITPGNAIPFTYPLAEQIFTLYLVRGFVCLFCFFVCLFAFFYSHLVGGYYRRRLENFTFLMLLPLLFF